MGHLAARALQLLSPPYSNLQPLGTVADLPRGCGMDGGILIWTMDTAFLDHIEAVRQRPPGVALVSILPPAPDLSDLPDLYRHVEECRPCAILPHYMPTISDVCAMLRHGPDNVAVEVRDYLAWRSPHLTSDSLALLRQTIALSANLRSVNALARSMYLSRRALGRRFLHFGLPVPSHVLHFGRLLRAYVKAQRHDLPLAAVASDLGYPDAFALSNQMKRLVGIRPSEARERLGWEWMVESWLTRESARIALRDVGVAGSKSESPIQKPRRRDGTTPRPAT